MSRRALLRNGKLAAVLDRLRQLRTIAVVAEVEFLHAVMRLEADESTWKGDPGARTGYVTFNQLLDEEDVCRPARYAKFKLCLQEFGLDKVREIGVAAAELVLPVPAAARSIARPDEPARTAILRDLTRFALDNDTPPSLQTSRAKVGMHYRPVLPPREPEESLAARCKRQDKELARLRRELARMRRRAEAAEAKLSAMTAPPASGSAASRSRTPLASRKN